MRRCTKCVLPETIPGISFDAQGVCSHCRNYHETEVKYDPEGFDRLLEKPRQDRLSRG